MTIVIDPDVIPLTSPDDVPDGGEEAACEAPERP